MDPKGKYEKPEITRITLKPEEATLSACKAAGTAAWRQPVRPSHWMFAKGLKLKASPEAAAQFRG